jgi:EAL domain-containing protein (putative c-di-GMP-specific phosphodiesterase class I)/GGDEF domain-containing protein
LRFKSQIFDPTTELPTLSAVLDDVRRLMEDRGSLGLAYLDLGADGQAETLHGWQAYDELLGAFARALRNLRLEAPFSSRDIVAILAVRSDKFLMFLGGAGPTLDRERLASAFSTLRERLQAGLKDQLPTSLKTMPVLSSGCALFHRDPMLRAERGVHRALDEAISMSLRERERQEDRRLQILDALIQGQEVVTLYQPILDLRDLSVVGHEVFTRGPSGGPFEDPDRLFALAERAGRMTDFERLSRHAALATVHRHLKPGCKLFLNTSARALQDPEVAGAGFVARVDALGLPHSQVVLEITERVAVEERQLYREALRSLKDAGFGIAIDDMGAGYSSLQAIVELEPDYLKFDISLVRNIDRSLIKRSLLETLVDLSERIGAGVIAEGIEARSELDTLREMGVRLGQGHYLAAPKPVP